jgi:LPXTG-motif cell wall-anchored protein
MEITAEVIGTGTITNTATVASSTDDPDPSNAVASAAITAGESLPTTGLDTSLLAAVGLALMAIGALLITVGRRRDRRIYARF